MSCQRLVFLLALGDSAMASSPCFRESLRNYGSLVTPNVFDKSLLITANSDAKSISKTAGRHPQLQVRPISNWRVRGGLTRYILIITLNHKGFLTFLFCSAISRQIQFLPRSEREVLDHCSMRKRGKQEKTFELLIYQLERRRSNSFGANLKHKTIFEARNRCCDCDQRGVS